ncbi:SMP-30/gluconolactonase/LRE family protein [Solibacillus sp. MA9]|uniref:SMP-30/gluconolactonase/LRE family protein n=1 Tax=Solibacillus palustris TaxID=2908203 RepID=A0ABS9UFM7_9BACL|nr:SMP-30/gluconolactonase/LRE family protein [Solibacillus sp. MA9]MCH7323147.1 SMP-30/gluconolactonase/LRE family protein [Solibacillus sp. MA9]
MEAKLKIKLQQTLGEGPLWDEKGQKVYWTDILNGCLYRFNLTGDAIEKRILPFHIGSFAFYEQEERMLLATSKGLFHYSFDDDQYEHLCEYFQLPSQMRCNDGKVDYDGDFWFGTMQYNPVEPQGSIFRYTKTGQLIEEARGFIIPNGISWFNDTMYIVDSGKRELYAVQRKNNGYDWDNKEVIFCSPEGMTPDGITIDSDGDIWIAIWGGGKVIRFNPQRREIVSEIIVPAPYVTSCSFTGEFLDTLWITTAKSDLSEEQLQKYPLSGSVFVVKTNSKGAKSSLYRGEAK